jgi:hypothetical protein
VAADRTATNLGRMYDDGTNGDVTAADKVFSRRVSLNEPSVGQLNYRASAGFRGVLRRTLSELIVLHVDPFPLPPDPGEVGKQTLEGIDSDGDGVRDDVQRWIAMRFFDSPHALAGVTQYASAVQRSLVEADNRTASVANGKEILKAMVCLYYVRQNDARLIHNELRSITLNTEERTRAWFQAQAHLSGGSFVLPAQDQDKSQCNFDTEALAR